MLLQQLFHDPVCLHCLFRPLRGKRNSVCISSPCIDHLRNGSNLFSRRKNQKMDDRILKAGISCRKPDLIKQAPTIQLRPRSPRQIQTVICRAFFINMFCKPLCCPKFPVSIQILPAALHDIRTGLLRFLQKRRNRSRQQYIVTIHKQKIFSFCLQNPGIACLRCTSTGFFRQLNPSDFSPVCIFLQDIAAAVCRIVVDCNNFHCIAALLRQNAVQTLL